MSFDAMQRFWQCTPVFFKIVLTGGRMMFDAIARSSLCTPAMVRILRENGRKKFLCALARSLRAVSFTTDKVKE